MITIGIDVGSLNTKAVVFQDDKILSFSVMPTGENAGDAAKNSMEEALKNAGVSDKVEQVVSTGPGAKEAKIAQSHATEVICLGKGSWYLNPNINGAIDIGAESCRVVKFEENGTVHDFALNDKCASGTGIFLNAMAKALEVKLEDMGELSLKSTEEINITSTCVVFAESEVVSQIHRRVNKNDILRGIHNSIASRVRGLANRLQLEGNILLAGGVALNVGVVNCLQEMITGKLIVPEYPQIVGALGAAIVGKERV